MTWNDARVECRIHSGSYEEHADLASIGNLIEQNAVFG